MHKRCSLKEHPLKIDETQETLKYQLNLILKQMNYKLKITRYGDDSTVFNGW